MNLLKSLRSMAMVVALLPLALLAPAPAFAYKIANATGDAMLDAHKALANSGTLVFYSGTQPANPDTALSGNTALATVTFSATAFGSDSTSGSNRQATASFVSSGSVTETGSGTATFARLYKSDGTTVVEDFTVGTSGADINLASTTFATGITLTISSLVLQQPVH